MIPDFSNWNVIQEDQDYYYIQVPKEDWTRIRNPLRTAPRANFMTNILSDLFAIPQPHYLNSMRQGQNQEYSNTMTQSMASARARGGGHTYASSSSSSSVNRNGVVYTTTMRNDNGVITRETSVNYIEPDRSQSRTTEYVAPEDRGQESSIIDTAIENEVNLPQQTVEQIQCPVCLEDFQNQPLMRCGHYVCKECLKQMVNIQCPVCRAEMSGGHCTQEIKTRIQQNGHEYRRQQNSQILREDETLISWMTTLGMTPPVLGSRRNLHGMFDI